MIFLKFTALQPSESKPVSKSSSYTSLSSVDKHSTAESEDKPVPADNQVIPSPALSETSVASSNKLGVGLSLETKTAEDMTVSKDENKDEKVASSSSSTSVSKDENKDEKAISMSHRTSKLSSTTKTSVTSHHLPSTDHTNAEQIFEHAISVVKDSHPDASSEASKPSLMVSSLDKQMAELQEALRAAGLPPIDGGSTENVAPVSAGGEPVLRSPSDLPEDIEQVLRELATQEVVSLSRKMLHEKQTEGEKAQTISQQLQTAQNCDEIRTQLHEKASKHIQIPSSDRNVVSSSENLLAEIASFNDFSTQSEDEAANDTKHTASVTKKKRVLKTNAKRENVFQRLATPKPNPAMKKPLAVKRVPPKSTRQSRIATASSHKKEKEPSFDGQGAYDLKSTTELKLSHKAKSVRSNLVQFCDLV